MSNKALWDQANHTLTVIGQQEPTLADIKTLHDGYLSALMQRIKRRRKPMMPLSEFRKSIGLGVLERLPLEVSVPALTEPFDPKDKFNVDISETATIKISGRGSNFESWMLTEVVPVRTGYELEPHTLTSDTDDEEILQDVERDDVDTDPAAIHYLVSQQPKGEEGPLLNNGKANIFYVSRKVEEQGKIRAVRRVVCVYWFDGGWDFSAFPLPSARAWSAGAPVFFRKSLGAVSV